MSLKYEPASVPQHNWVPREQKMLKGPLPRVIYHQVYLDDVARKALQLALLPLLHRPRGVARLPHLSERE